MRKKVSFNELINDSKPVLVDFSAEWCGPCKAMAPILKQVASAVGDKAKIVKIDVDRNQSVAAKYAIQSVPTLILFKAGKIVWRQSGMQSAKMLTETIESNMESTIQ
jgi:thioredoxin 1